MKPRATLSLLGLLFLAHLAVVPAQSPGPAAQPGPEVERLAYFLGKWRGEVEIKASAAGPAARVNETAEGEWLPGRRFLVTHWDTQMAAGAVHTLMILGYDPEEKVYTFNTFQSTGESAYAKGPLVGDTWTWTSKSKDDGKAGQSRFTIRVLSPSAYATKFEMSMDGNAWTTIMEGRVAKLK